MGTGTFVFLIVVAVIAAFETLGKGQAQISFSYNNKYINFLKLGMAIFAGLLLLGVFQ